MKNRMEKAELQEWLKKLMEFARVNKLSTRIIDGINDCIKMTEMRNSDMDKIKAEVEEVLESIEHKAAPSREREVEKGISIEEIREQIAGMAKRCRSENVGSLQNIEKRKQALIQKSYFDLQEITHCEAHLDELKSNERYHRFYEQVKVSHEKEAVHIFKEFLDDMANNYQNMMEHIKSVFRSISGEKSGFGSRRFYEEHDIRKGEIAGKLETIAQNSDCGGNNIEEFENATKGKIRNIVQKNLFKMRFLILLPVLVVFMSLALAVGLKYAVTENGKNTAAQEQESNEGFVLEKLKGSDLMDCFLNLIPKSSKEISMDVVVFVILLIIVIYAMYIRFLKRMCDRQICSKCNEYLQMEWLQFRQKDPLLQKMDMVLINLQNEYERQYLDVLNQLFCRTEYHISDGSNKDPFTILKEEWDVIKYS